jgi:hypothetical protein
MELPPLEPEYAPLGHRVAARVIDLVVHYGVVLYASICLGFAAAVMVPEQMDAITTKFGENTFFGVGLSVLGSVLYHTCMEGFTAAPSACGYSASPSSARRAGRAPCARDGNDPSHSCSTASSSGWSASWLRICRPGSRESGDDWADTVVVRTLSLPARSGTHRRRAASSVLCRRRDEAFARGPHSCVGEGSAPVLR